MKRIWNTRNVAIGAMIIGAGLLLSTRLLAQSGPETPEDAAKMFTDAMYLRAFEDSPRSPAIDPEDFVSRKDLRLLESYGVRNIIGELLYGIRLSRFQSKTIGKTSKSAVVDVTPVKVTPGTKSIVVIREGNIWRVDLVKTFARWNKLDDKAALRRISSLTGVLLPGVSTDARGYSKACQSNLGKLALGILQYSQDYDEMLPPAHEWNTAIQPYVASSGPDRYYDSSEGVYVASNATTPPPEPPHPVLRRIFHCPKVGNNKYGYAMNGKLNRGNSGLIETPAQTVLLFDSRRMYRNAFGSENEIAFRHQPAAEAGANYAYADGHVSWRSARQKQNFEPRFSEPRPGEIGVIPIPGAPPRAPFPSD